MHYIYKITNLINDKIYIGQTDNPNRRWREHKTSIRKKSNNQLISKAIAKYNYLNFKFEVIATCKTQEDADAAEELIISQYDSRNLNIGYNLRAGGNCSNHSQISIRKMSKSAMGKPGTNLGKTFSDEWRSNLSKSQIGKDKKYKRRFSEDIEKEICKLYRDSGESMYAIAKRFSCHRSLISDILNRNDVVARKTNYTKNIYKRNKFTLEQEKEICKFYLEGNVSKKHLADKFNCGKTTIRDILLRNGVKL
jgi:hypothetical protein